MKAKRRWIHLTAGILGFLSILAGMMTFAQEVDKAQIQQEFRNRLSDSNGVSVYVDVITNEKSEEESLTTKLQEDVEYVLKDSNIRILAEDELEYAPGRPHLGVYRVTYKEPGSRDLYLYSFRVTHFEDASLAKTINTPKVFAGTAAFI